MAGKTQEETIGGCFAWLIRAKKAVNERWARARNALRRRLVKENKLSKPLTADDLENETGSPDLLITKIRVSPGSFRSHGSISSVKELSSVIDCIAAKSASSEVQKLLESQHQVGVSLQRTQIDCTLDGSPDPEQVKKFVQRIIDKAVDEIRTHGQDKIVSGTDITAIAGSFVADVESLTSSVVSVIADDVVKQSMTNIIREFDDTTLTVVKDSSSLSSAAIRELADAVVAESLTSILTGSDDVNHSATPRPRTVTEVLEALRIDPTIGRLQDDEEGFPPCVP